MFKELYQWCNLSYASTKRQILYSLIVDYSIRLFIHLILMNSLFHSYFNQFYKWIKDLEKKKHL
jgi:hypothetical protein